MAVILCVEHDPPSGGVLERTLAGMGYEPKCVSRLDEACLALERGPVDLILTDSRLPDGTALDLLAQLRTREAEIPVIVMTAYGSLEDALVAMRNGALDYLTLPARGEALRLAVRQALEVTRLRRENLDFRREIGHLRGEDAIVGESRSFRAALDEVARLAPFEGPVAFEGEPGTGKELLARALHARSPRRDQPLITVSCAALPEEALAEVLLGPPGAAAARPGSAALERARGGALLLTEIARMPLALQARFEQALQAARERASGARDVRLLATSSLDLGAAAGGGRLLRALRDRFAGRVVRTPALRERVEDIPALARHFVRLCAARLGIQPPEIEPATIEWLCARRWPGNVRELENAVEHAVILRRGGTLSPASFELPGRAGEREDPDREVLNLRELERRAIRRALETTRGHRGRAALLLGISERTLRNKLYESPELATALRRPKPV